MILILCILIVAMIVLLWWPFPVDGTSGRGYCPESDPWEDPVTVRDLISQEECQEIIKIAEPLFARSGVVGKVAPDDDRTSETAWIPRTHPIARKIFERACELSGSSIENCEDLQVVRYMPGTFYRPHHDSCCENTDGCREFEQNGGQRIGTLLVYLNDDFVEGRTHFPKMEKMFRAPAGNGLFFKPLGSNGQCHPHALHGGMPPTSGTKYLCNAWVRENNFVVPH
jgi:prolyl 4-hydroxylase